MTEAVTLLLFGTSVVLLAVLLVVMSARGRGQRDAASGTALLQQQLGELRGRLDAIASAQHAMPQALGQRLDETGRAVADVRERLGRLAEATRRLEAIGESVADVQQLLQVPRLRGQLGEVWLEELLRQIFPAALYERQYAFRSAERVDAVVRVGARLVPIDAKFPLEACQRMLAASGDEAERERRAFRRALRARIDEIADKYIRPDEGTFEFALMYIPAENVYYEAIVRGEALHDDRSVLAYAMDRKVIPVSPHTFYAYLSAVLHGLKGLEVEERAREIQAELGALRGQFQRFWTAFEKVGGHLGNAAKQYAECEREAGRVQQRLDAIANGAAPELQPATGEIS